jgi:hypothetical protein
MAGTVGKDRNRRGELIMRKLSAIPHHLFLIRMVDVTASRSVTSLPMHAATGPIDRVYGAARIAGAVVQLQSSVSSVGPVQRYSLGRVAHREWSMAEC